MRAEERETLKRLLGERARELRNDVRFLRIKHGKDNSRVLHLMREVLYAEILAITIPQICRGMQVVYVPKHAESDITHEDCEYGIVEYVTGEAAAVRYFHGNPLMDEGEPELRTKANAEITPVKNLRVCPEAFVSNDRVLEILIGER